MRRFSAILVAVVAAVMCNLAPLVAQPHARADFEFGHYLLGNGLLRDAEVMSRMPLDEGLYTPAALDSLRHLKGWTLYSLRKFDEAIPHFGSVDAASPLYAKSAFYGAISGIEQRKIDVADTILSDFAQNNTEPKYAELLAFERAGVALLKGDTEAYGNYQKSFTYSDFALADEQRTLDQIAATAPRNLSPWVAGVASAVVPGLGQIYAGNLGEGLASMLLVGVMAGLTADSWVRAGGPCNWRTILYGSVGTLLYVGNICGSVASVRVYYKQFDEQRTEAVVCSLHIPLRTIFK